MSSSQPQDTITSVLSDDDDACPVCLCNPSEELTFLAGPCGHAVCQPCMERILLTQHSQSETHIPTRGMCPICRRQMSLFELTIQNSDAELAFPKNTQVSDSPIGGLIYAGRPGGGPTFHFDEDIPYVTIENGTRISFETFHWHSKSRTFHGTLTDALLREWDVVLQFSSDLRFISNGVVTKRSIHTNCNEFPLDGEWLVQWESGARAIIHVGHNVFHHGPHRYMLDLSNKEEINFKWPTDLGVTQTAVRGVNLESQPQGPPVGSHIVWRTTENERIVWTRGSMGDENIERFGPGGRMYRRIDAGTRTRPTYHGDLLWGNTFCQSLHVGLASYKFLSPEDGAYISYENPMCARWPPLDDGTPVPSQVYFKNMSFDDSERVFRGSIEWLQEFGTTWQGCSKWIYEIKFDTEYTCVISGGVKSVFHGNDDDEQDMSTFGVDLVYINAAIMEKFETLMTNDSDEEEVGYDRYVQVSQSLRSRLQREGASIRTIATMNHVLTATQQPGADPFDYNLS